MKLYYLLFTVERCKEVTCPTTLNEEECGEGMYYEEGPSFFDHCCPANGRCVCNITLCDDDPPEECPEGNKLMTEKADHQKGQCCDNHYCKKGMMIKYLATNLRIILMVNSIMCCKYIGYFLIIFSCLH